MRLAFLLVIGLSCSAAQAIPLNLRVGTSHRERYVGTTSTTTWSISPFLEPTFSPDLISYTLADSSGKTLSNKTAGTNFASATPINVPTFAAFQSAGSSAPWTLDVQTTQGTSRYALTPGLASRSEASFVSAEMVTPRPLDNIAADATFRWQASRYYGQSFISTGAGSFADLGYHSSTPRQFYKPPTPLPRGSYRLELMLLEPRPTQLPISATLLSGVDQGPITASIEFEFQLSVPYTVPEPTVLGGVSLLSILLRRTRRA